MSRSPSASVRVLAALLWLLSCLVPEGLTLGAATTGTLAVVGAAVAMPGDAWARGKSGGYSRPSASKAPSVSRTPSSSGGYSRPRTPSVGASAPRTPSAATPSSAGDRAMSRGASGDALGRYRDSQRAPSTVPSARTSTSSSTSAGGSGFTVPRGDGFTIPRDNGWYAGRGWSPPSYARASSPQFGMWNGLLLWFLLDRLNEPGNASFFHDRQNDPGYREWRSEADRKAKDDPELRRKLTQLDGELSAREGQPRNPDALPPGVPPEAALASTSSDWGDTMFWLTPLILGGVVFVLWRSRRRFDVSAPVIPARKGNPVNPLNTVANILRQKASGEAYKPTLFRVGMVMTIDPAPFLLAAGVTKVEAPAAGQATSVEAVGRLVAGKETLHRLYLPGGASFFQIHLGPAGEPDECRYFSILDEVAPADEGEWAFWLDKAEGMVGWPEFETKDGKVYPRLWVKGATRVPPRKFQETADTVQGLAIRSEEAMLYGAPTGSAEPAPQTEYILVAVIEEEGRAWVRIAAGIDVNPASLSLS